MVGETAHNQTQPTKIELNNPKSHTRLQFHPNIIMTYKKATSPRSHASKGNYTSPTSVCNEENEESTRRRVKHCFRALSSVPCDSWCFKFLQASIYCTSPCKLLISTAVHCTHRLYTLTVHPDRTPRLYTFLSANFASFCSQNVKNCWQNQTFADKSLYSRHVRSKCTVDMYGRLVQSARAVFMFEWVLDLVES